MIKKIDNIQKYTFIIISLFSLVFYIGLDFSFKADTQNYILFILVSLVGIPHGFFDFSIGRKIFEKYFNAWFIIFTASYISISALYLTTWVLFPEPALIFFLAIAAYHFGYEDYNYLSKNKINYRNINIFIKGLIIVMAPIIFHYDEVRELFSILTNSDFRYHDFSQNNKILFLVLSFAYIIFDNKSSLVNKTEGLVSIVNFILLPPIISFVLYFCFLHSIRHFIESILILKNVPKGYSIKYFIFLIVTISLVTSIISIILFSNLYQLSINETIIKYIFMALACLTLPHMIFNMWPKK